PAKRTDAINARLHASIGDIAKQLDWAGKRRDIETWKRLLVAAWLRARGEALEILPAIDGRGVDIVFKRTSKLTQRETGELCEYVYAWGAQN
ncbi:recombination protein NinB, partial [Streptococcus pneumoniae]|uniref:recombination protein NinB n=1 Tax=Streptococcus pneumoniae TaxID=1313 RepID=UPI001327A740